MNTVQGQIKLSVHNPKL